jgi:hypothetical protein
MIIMMIRRTNEAPNLVTGSQEGQIAVNRQTFTHNKTTTKYTYSREERREWKKIAQ